MVVLREAASGATRNRQSRSSEDGASQGRKLAFITLRFSVINLELVDLAGDIRPTELRPPDVELHEYGAWLRGNCEKISATIMSKVADGCHFE